jgi:dolichol kinase
VSKVATFAFLVFSDFVSIRHRRILLDVFLVTIEAFFAFEFALFRIRRGREARQRDAEAKKARPRAHKSPASV